jgi:tRNA(Ile)-lysidine synthase
MNKQKSVKIPFFRKVPKSVYLAFSGGVDSAVLLHRLIAKNTDVVLFFVHHQTTWCDKELEFALATAKQHGIGCIVKRIEKYDKAKHKTSMESYWSQCRNTLFQELDRPVLTAHHLDDASEWYVMSSLQGQSKLLSYQNNNVIRPFIIVDKSKIINYAVYHNVQYISDPSNSDTTFNLRNKVRKDLMPEILKTFPGVNTSVRKLILAKERKALEANII